MKRFAFAVVMVLFTVTAVFAARIIPTDDNGRAVQTARYDATKTVTFYVTKSYTYTLPTSFTYLGYHFVSEATDCIVDWNADGKSWAEPKGSYYKDPSMTSIRFTNASTAAPGKKITVRFW